MTWLQYRLETTAAAAPLCEEALLQLGAAAVTLEDNADQPLFEHARKEQQLWQQTRVSGLFPADTDTDALWRALPQALREQSHGRAEILEDKDWEREWMQHYQPVQYAADLWICPSWLKPPQPQATNIMLDPGLAFGTGTHPTTAMCLRLLAAMDLENKQVTDFGCGSGVLAIGALLLGARAALGVDTDPQALTATRSNAQRNRIEAQRLQLRMPAELDGSERADLVVANILAGPLCDLTTTLCEQLRPGGILILSGILAEQTPLLQDSYPLALAVADERDGWVALQGVCE
jgi:ribosomal protein L11 methyltransferase